VHSSSATSSPLKCLLHIHTHTYSLLWSIVYCPYMHTICFVKSQPFSVRYPVPLFIMGESTEVVYYGFVVVFDRKAFVVMHNLKLTLIIIHVLPRQMASLTNFVVKEILKYVYKYECNSSFIIFCMYQSNV
jgi:hypothetical protein